MGYLEVDDLTRFFQDGHEGFIYTYYRGTHPLEVYLEYDITMDAKYMHRYSLKENKGVWLMTEESQVSVGWAENSLKPHTEVAGSDQQSAITFMIDTILSKPRNHASAHVDTDALRSALRDVLF